MCSSIWCGVTIPPSHGSVFFFALHWWQATVQWSTNSGPGSTCDSNLQTNKPGLTHAAQQDRKANTCLSEDSLISVSLNWPECHLRGVVTCTVRNCELTPRKHPPLRSSYVHTEILIVKDLYVFITCLFNDWCGPLLITSPQGGAGQITF